jgi:hypothetical protein
MKRCSPTVPGAVLLLLATALPTATARPAEQTGPRNPTTVSNAAITAKTTTGSIGTPTAGSVPCATADELLVPACGVWWGIWPRTDGRGTRSNNLPANLSDLESAIGRRFDLVSRYKGWGENLYDAWDRSFRDSGRIVLEDLTARNFRTNTYTSWTSIADGDHDEYLVRQAARVRAFGARTFLSFNQEPEQALERGGIAGEPEDFARAYRHVHDLFVAEGATNAVWVWWVMGWSGHNDVYPELWPGADYVDWIAYDPYDFNTCHSTGYKTPADTLSRWYRWIDAQPWADDKPIMLAEYGSNGADKGAWYAQVPQALTGLPRIRAAVEFNSAPGRCDHRVTSSANNLAGFRVASSHPLVNPGTTTGLPTPTAGVRSAF